MLLVGIFSSSILVSLLVSGVKFLLGHNYQVYDVFTVALYSFIYTMFSVIGIAIAWLLCYAFKKERKQ